MKAVSTSWVPLVFLFALAASNLAYSKGCIAPEDRDCRAVCNYTGTTSCVYESVDCTYCWNELDKGRQDACFASCGDKIDQSIAAGEECARTEMAKMQECQVACAAEDKKNYDAYQACLKNKTQQQTSDEVQITHADGTSAPLGSRSVVAGDTVRTGDKGTTVTTEDGAHIYLAPNTVYRVQSPAEHSLIEGAVLWLKTEVKKFDYEHYGRYHIRMPSAVFAVRGTEFILKYANGRTMLYLYDGEADITPVVGGVDMINETKAVQAKNIAVVEKGVITVSPLSEEQWAMQYAAFEDAPALGTQTNQTTGTNQTTDGTENLPPANPCATTALLLSVLFLFAFAQLKRR